ncbi:MAG: TIGR04076 family protein [Bacteroidales bacterium]|nr:TIGR04076 family protein [Bacteroidales bacterium]
MRTCRITAVRQVEHRDLMALYENPITHACSIQEGDTFLSHEGQKPEGMCESAWMNLAPFVLTLAAGGSNIYDGWMRNPDSALISCNDGFRPMSFLIEALND